MSSDLEKLRRLRRELAEATGRAARCAAANALFEHATALYRRGELRLGVYRLLIAAIDTATEHAQTEPRRSANS